MKNELKRPVCWDEVIGHQAEFFRIGVIGLFDPPVVRTARRSERTVDLPRFDVTVEDVVEQRLELSAVLVCSGHSATIDPSPVWLLATVFATHKP